MFYKPSDIEILSKLLKRNWHVKILYAIRLSISTWLIWFNITKKLFLTDNI